MRTRVERCAVVGSYRDCWGFWSGAETRLSHLRVEKKSHQARVLECSSAAAINTEQRADGRVTAKVTDSAHLCGFVNHKILID